MTNSVKNILLNISKNKITNINNLLFWDYNKDTFITPNEVASYLRKLNAKYNIAKSLHTHKLRHTFITRCAEKGIYPKVIQTLVGHVKGSSITNQVYTSISQSFIENELKKLIKFSTALLLHYFSKIKPYKILTFQYLYGFYCLV